MTDLIKAKNELEKGGYTCVLCKGDRIFCSTERGVKPLVGMLESGEDLIGFSAADKVVGKATAFLYALLGVRAVFARVISRAALETLLSHGIETEYDILSEHIINRKGDGICPFEAAVLGIDDKITAYKAIRLKMRELNIDFK